MKKEEWHSVDQPPTEQITVEVMDDKGQIRYGEPCYYPFNIIDGKVIQLDKMEHDGSWLINGDIMNAVPFGVVTMWRHLTHLKR